MKVWIFILIAVATVVLILASVDLRPAQEHKHSDYELAKGCNVSVEAFRTAKASVKSATDRKPTKTGRCYLIKNGDGHISLGVVTEPPAEPKK